MSWCDKVTATPSVGYKLSPSFMSSATILNAVAPLIERAVPGDHGSITLETSDPFTVQYTTENGFQTGFDPHKIFVNFSHRINIRSVVGGLPQAILLSEPAPYSGLLPTVTDRLIEATMLHPEIKKRSLLRIGIIANIRLSELELPPGITSLIDYFGVPWGKLKGAFHLNFTGNLEKTKDHADQCIHLLRRFDNPEQPMELNFDWQRTFTNGWAVTREALEKHTKTAEKAALKYFEELAEGNRFDEINVAQAN